MPQSFTELATKVVPEPAVSFDAGVKVWLVSHSSVLASGDAVGVPKTVGV